MNPWWKRPSPGEREERPSEKKERRREKEDATVRSTDVLTDVSSDALADAEEISPRRKRGGDEKKPPPRAARKEERRRTDSDEEDEAGTKPRRRRRRSGSRRTSTEEAAPKAPEKRAQEPAPPAKQPKSAPAAGVARLALLCDVETLATNVRAFDPRALLELLGERGKLVVKRGYADWRHHGELKELLHGASMELIDVPRHGRNRTGAEMKMVVDALETCYARPHVDTFVLVSGRRELLPLVAKLREADKRIIGVGNRAESERELVDNCDEFLFLDDFGQTEESPRREDGGADGEDDSKPSPRRRRRRRSRSRTAGSDQQSRGGDEPSEREAAELTPTPAAKSDRPSTSTPPAAKESSREETSRPEQPSRERRPRPRPRERPLEGEELQRAVIEAAREVLDRPQRQRAWSSLVQQALRERDPELNERALGYDGFTDLLREAEEEGLLELGHDERTGLHYVVSVSSPS